MHDQDNRFKMITGHKLQPLLKSQNFKFVTSNLNSRSNGFTCAIGKKQLHTHYLEASRSQYQTTETTF